MRQRAYARHSAVRNRMGALAAAGSLILAAALIGGPLSSAAHADSSVFGLQAPPVGADPDTASVELGLRFSPDVDGVVTAIRFYKTVENVGPHLGTLWSAGGTRLAGVSFAGETNSGWQETQLTVPVPVRAGASYVVSYGAPHGRYVGLTHAFDMPFRSGHLRIPAGGGLYKYGSGIPDGNWENSNYYVDVQFRVPGTGGTSTSSSTTIKITTATSSVSSTQTATSTSSSTGTTSTTGTSSMTGTSSTSPSAGVLQLPRVPWEGAGYWAAFPKARSAGWADPSFFPIALWYGSAGVQEQVVWDKSHGINTYVQNNPGNPYSLLQANNMFSLYTANGAPTGDTQQVGMLLDDEVDGRFSDVDGIAYLKALAAQYTPAGSGLFSYVNYTSGIVTYDRTMESSSGYLNGSFNDVIGLDQYFYSNPHCDTLSLRWRTPVNGTTIDRTNCRTASSYGKMVDLQREVNAMVGSYKPIWAFVEVISPGGGANGYVQPTGAQIIGAAWNSIIHGARGIDWFSQSPDGGTANTCPSGDALRDARTGTGACPAVAANVEAMGQVNAQIKQLAPVINTQSYVWNFGSGIDSMLKVKDGYAYAFAMTRDGGTGSRAFALPAGVSGRTAEVVGEGRTIAISGTGSFSDSFAQESSHHVYKISLS